MTKADFDNIASELGIHAMTMTLSLTATEREHIAEIKARSNRTPPNNQPLRSAARNLGKLLDERIHAVRERHLLAYPLLTRAQLERMETIAISEIINDLTIRSNWRQIPNDQD